MHKVFIDPSGFWTAARALFMLRCVISMKNKNQGNMGDLEIQFRTLANF